MVIDVLGVLLTVSGLRSCPKGGGVVILSLSYAGEGDDGECAILADLKVQYTQILQLGLRGEERDSENKNKGIC